MRNASGALIALLNSGTQFYIADLLTIIQKSGAITRLTSAPVDVLSTSQAITPADPTVYTFVAGGVTFARGRVKVIVGTEVDDMNITLLCGDADTLGGVPWPQAARGGAFDGARFVLERVYMATWNDTSAGTLIVFGGQAGDVHPARHAIAVTVKSDLAILANPMPRNSYQPGCLHNLYDAGCTLAAATFTVSGAINNTSTTTALFTNLASVVPGYYELGVITFTSGANNGLKRTVKTYGAGAVEVVPALPVAPGIGDTFTIYPGCDKQQATCSTKFANLTHFRGFPYVPVPETAG
jgi:uncharacterized phage protein (TIGR02218 family)